MAARDEDEEFVKEKEEEPIDYYQSQGMELKSRPQSAPFQSENKAFEADYDNVDTVSF